MSQAYGGRDFLVIMACFCGGIMYLSAMSLCQTSRQYGSAEFGTLGGGAGSAEEQTLAPWGLEVPNSVLPRTRLGTRGGTVSGTFGHENVKNYTPPRGTACVGGGGNQYFGLSVCTQSEEPTWRFGWAGSRFLKPALRFLRPTGIGSGSPLQFGSLPFMTVIGEFLTRFPHAARSEGQSYNGLIAPWTPKCYQRRHLRKSAVFDSISVAMALRTLEAHINPAPALSGFTLLWFPRAFSPQGERTIGHTSPSMSWPQVATGNIASGP